MPLKMRRIDFIKLLGLTACSQEMILPQQIARSVVGPSSSVGLLLVAGQSNAEKGVLLVSVDLAPPYDVAVPEVQYYGDDGTFYTLDPSDQNAYQSPINGVTDNYAHQFYFYNRLRLAMGVNTLVVCAHSVGDTNLATDWNSAPAGSLYTTMVNRINACKTLILSTYGFSPSPIVFVWDQGEKDGRVALDANAYTTNEGNFFTNVRTACGFPTLKFLVPLIKLASINGSPNPVQFGANVNDAKVANKNASPTSVQTVDCNDCEPSTDGVHFTATGQFDKNTKELQVMIDAGWLSGTPTVIPSNQTYFDGYSNFVRFGDILDSLWAVATQWRIGLTVWKPARYTFRTLVSKFTSTGNQRCFHWFHLGDTIVFNYYMNVGSGGQIRGVTWTGLLAVLYDGNEHTLELRYDGTIGTNNGLDRPSLYVDGVLYTTGKTLSTNVGALATIFNSTAQLAVGALVDSAGVISSSNFIYNSYAKDFFVQNGAAVDQLRCPNLAAGTDTSGNGNNGTYV